MGRCYPPAHGVASAPSRIRRWDRTVARRAAATLGAAGATGKGAGWPRRPSRRNLDVRALRRRASGELDMQLRRRGQGGAGRPRGLGPGADPDQPSSPGPDRPPRTRGDQGAGPGAARSACRRRRHPDRGPGCGGGRAAPERGGRGVRHPATQLEILHAAPAFAVAGSGWPSGWWPCGPTQWDRLALLAGLLVCNQYAAGALNDAVDAEADAAADRGKPIQRGVISRRAVATAAVVAGVASLGFGSPSARPPSPWPWSGWPAPGPTTCG